MAYDIFNDPNMAPGIQGVKVSAMISQGGISRILTRTYKVDEELTSSFYGGIGQELKTNDVPIGYGRVMLTGTLVDSGILRSDLDPAKIKRVVQFVTTEGPTKGIVGVDSSKLESVYVGGKKVKTDTGQSQDIGLKEILGGLAASAAVVKGVDYVKELLGFDTETGAALPDSIKNIFGDNGKINLSDIDGFDAKGGGFNQIMAYDSSTKKVKLRPFVDVHKESGIEVDDIVVMKDGTAVRTDTMTFNFIGANVTVTDVGGDGKQVNIEFTGGTGGGGTDPGEPTNKCSVSVAVECDPMKDSRYFLKRDSKVISALLIDINNASSFTSRDLVANRLVTKTIIPDAFKSYRYTVTQSGSLITISGDATCKPCDLGTWSIDCWSPPKNPKDPPQTGGSTGVDPCAPRKPSLTV